MSMAFFGAGPFYDVSWLVSGMVVREWDSFCPNPTAASFTPKSSETLQASSSGAHAQQPLDTSNLHVPEYYCSKAPTVESSLAIRDTLPDLHLQHSDEDIGPGTSKSYALCSSHFHVRSQFNPSSWPTLWLELPLEDQAADTAALDDIRQWLGSSECSISRLILACGPRCGAAHQASVAISSILSMLAQSQRKSSIRHLVFYNCALSTEVHWPLLVYMLQSCDCPVQSVAFAHRSADVDLKSLVSILQHPSCGLSELLIHNSPNIWGNSGIERLLQPLYSQNSSLRRLSLSSCCLSDGHMEDICCLLRSPNCKVTALNLSSNFFTITGLQCLKEALIHSYAENSTSTTPLQMLSFCGHQVHVEDKKVTKAVAEVLKTAGCKLTVLDLTGRNADSEWVSHLSQILQGDKCQLLSLYLFHSALYKRSDRLSEELLCGLKMNKTIINVCFPWSKEAYKQMALNVVQRNMSLQGTNLKEETLVMPKCVKLFICGHERAGKSTLRKKLVDSSFAPFKKQPRTEGTRLCRITLPDNKSVVVCDLKGQREYHALHHLFIASSNEDIFAVVCKYGEESNKLQKRLTYWLSFIVSLRARPHPRPVVILVVNFSGFHIKDMAGKARSETRSAVQDFGALLNFGEEGSPNVFGVDLSPSVLPLPWNPTAQIIDSLKQKVEALASELMNAGMPIFKISEDIRSAIVDLSRSGSNRYKKLPIIMTVQELLEEFASLCSTGGEALEAALVDLHKQHQVVFFRDDVCTCENPRGQQIVILDPAWFYETLIGSFVQPLIQSGGRNKALQGQCSKTSLKEHIVNNKLCEDRFVDSILNYLAKLELYFVLSSDGRVLFPSMLSEDGNLTIINVNKQPCGPFYGRRLVCENSETSLLPWAVFARLQVQLHAEYGGRDKPNFGVGYGWISLEKNEVSALIKFLGATREWEDPHWIDVMVFLPTKSSWQHVLDAEEIICKARNSVLQICEARHGGGLKLSLQEKVLKHISDIEPVLLLELKKKVHMEGINVEMPLSKHLLPGELRELVNENAEAVKMLRKELKIHEDEESARSNKAIDQLMCVFNPASVGDVGNTEVEEVVRKVVEELKSAMETLFSKLSKQLLKDRNDEEQLPLLPLLISDEGAGAWGKLKWMVNKKAKLHLMCEWEHGCHRVEKQKGVTVHLRSWERLVEVVSALGPGVKLVYGAAKIAAAVFLPGSQVALSGMEGLFDALSLDEKVSIQRHKATFPQLLSSLVEGLPEDIAQQNLVRLLRSVDAGPQSHAPLLKQFYLYVLEGHTQHVDMERDFSLALVRATHTDATAWLCDKHAGNAFPVRGANPFKQLF